MNYCGCKLFWSVTTNLTKNVIFQKKKYEWIVAIAANRFYKNLYINGIKSKSKRVVHSMPYTASPCRLLELLDHFRNNTPNYIPWCHVKAYFSWEPKAGFKRELAGSKEKLKIFLFLGNFCHKRHKFTCYCRTKVYFSVETPLMR